MTGRCLRLCLFAQAEQHRGAGFERGRSTSVLSPMRPRMFGRCPLPRPCSSFPGPGMCLRPPASTSSTRRLDGDKVAFRPEPPHSRRPSTSVRASPRRVAPWHAGDLREEGHGPARAGVHLEHEHSRRFPRRRGRTTYWMFVSPIAPARGRSAPCSPGGPPSRRHPGAGGGYRHGVARVHAGALDVLHDPGIRTVSPSQIASTSTSRPSRNLSMRIGLPCATSAASFTKPTSSVAFCTTSIARPPAHTTAAPARGSQSPPPSSSPPRSFGWRARRGCGMPRSCRKRSNRRRSSAVSMVSALEPMIGRPARRKGSAMLIAVWPPNWTIEAGVSEAPVSRSRGCLGSTPRQAARSRGGRSCRSRWRRFPGWSSP